MEAAECGAACLAMALSSHGREIPLEEARERCATSRDGVDAAALATAAASYGLTVKAVRREPETLGALPLPAILHWGFNHFVVLDAVRGGAFVLRDPALGRRVVNAEEMSDNFTGLALAMAPGPDFTRGGARPSVTRALAAQARGSWDGLGLVFLLGVVSAAPGLALSGAVETFADHVIGQGRLDWVFWVLFGVAGVVALQAAIGGFRAWIVAAIQAKIGVLLAAQAFHHALRLPLRFFASRSASEVVSRLRVGSELGSAVAGPLAQIAPNAVTALLFVAVAALYDPVIGLVVGVVSLLNLFWLSALSRRLADANRLHHVKDGVAGGAATAGFAAFEAYRLLGRQSLFAERWMAAEEAALETEQALGRARALAGLGPAAALLLTSVVVVSVGAARVMEGALSLSALLALQVLAGLICAPIAAIARDLIQLQEAAGPITRLEDVMRHPADPALAPDALAAPPAASAPRDGLTLDRVGFGFGPNAPLFQGLSLAFEPGRLTALTGPSGAGKSTLARICAGLLAPSSGTVRLEGAPLAAWPRPILRERLRFVTQAPDVFSASMAENVTLWDGRWSDREIVDAMRRARCENLLSRGGLTTALSNAAPGFSGGEIQRLCLARAFLGDPAVVILDEPTSALDGETQAEVLESLRDTGAAVVMVTHSPAAAAACDRVITLDGRGGAATTETAPAGLGPTARDAAAVERRWA